MILKAAYSFSALSSFQIYYGMGKKGKYRSLEISFPDDAFHHLAGFQYITRNPVFVSKRMALYNVISRKITEADFSTSSEYKMISNRWAAIVEIENAMMSARTILEYTKKSGPIGSKIKARFVILHTVEENNHYYFFDGKTDESLVPVCCLTENKQQYELGCARWTVLKIEKISRDGSSSKIIYCHDSINPND